MTLIAILTGTLAAGIGSVWLAALLSFGVLARYTNHMLSLAAGALLATAFMHLLPEAFESQAGAQELFATLLVGLVFFFLLDKAELYHHGHEHHDPQGQDDAGPLLAPLRSGNSGRAEHVNTAPGPLEQGHPHHHHGHSARSGSWAVLTGDSVHAFGDGILIASAFVADTRLGVITALAVLAHEVPHHMGDLVVLRHTSSNRSAALIKVSLAGAVTALGGLIGYALVDMLHDWLPYFLVVASSSFVYVALADLIPQLQKRLTARETLAQIAWLGVGIALVTLVSGLAHSSH
ncbi:MAG: ZIP family metal transporter [Polaromonas sp.]|uniref:ZIP family metal transporter n=1 Tax=Polaromonas sp. TaxID=1869339 RepID=UPI002489C44F|nr:ZIP family metal transporter [Polaromonas sp.]MDI1239615.1 ZIP family metal transporter [Polaromonas sp.]MDI1339222.1 ZIP family metal transporter [Polaromonas sp.]